MTAIIRSLGELPLRGPPPTSLILVHNDRSGLATAVDAVKSSGNRAIVVSTQPLSDAALSSVAPIADDVLEWADTTVEAIAARLGRWREIHRLLTSAEVTSFAIGNAEAHRECLAELIELACHSGAPVLLTGETGTGKEVSARLLHKLSPRRGKPFVVVDCTTIVPTLSGSELFGHERGAFTGADSTRTGAIFAADGGTLFLDEIGDLAAPVQAELLRVIQEGTYKPVGGNRWCRADFRLVSATNRDLRLEVEGGRFRQDLYHRIAGSIVELPPLRARIDDLEPLFASFLAEAMHVTAAPPVSVGVSRLLRQRAYPGNLRDLRQLAVRVAARHTGPGAITIGDLPAADRRFRLEAAALRTVGPAVAATTESESIETDVRQLVMRLLDRGDQLKAITRLVTDTMVNVALDESSGSTRVAARRLGVTERAVQLRRAADRTVDAS